jgi:hypothetical protein
MFTVVSVGLQYAHVSRLLMTTYSVCFLFIASIVWSVLLDSIIILGFSLKVETYKAMVDTQLSTDWMIYISCLPLYVQFEENTDYYYYYTKF